MHIENNRLHPGCPQWETSRHPVYAEQIVNISWLKKNKKRKSLHLSRASAIALSLLHIVYGEK